MRLLLTSIFLCLTLSGNAGVPLDSLFVEAVVRADSNSILWQGTADGIKKKLTKNGNKLYNKFYSNDTIFIICDYDFENQPQYYILCPDLNLSTDLDEFRDASITFSRMRESTPEMEWIENWEPDSLRKYGLRDKSLECRVHGGIYSRYIIRYIIHDDSVLSDSVEYAPYFNYHKWDKWRERKRTSAGNRE